MVLNGNQHKSVPAPIKRSGFLADRSSAKDEQVSTIMGSALDGYPRWNGLRVVGRSPDY